MGRKKIRIAKISDTHQRYVTFCKRRHGLYNKAAEICMQHDAQVLLVLHSPSASSKFYSLAYPSAEAIIDGYMSNSSPITGDDVEQSVLSQHQKVKELEEQLKGEKAKGKKKKDPLWWQKKHFEECNSMEELERMRDAMRKIKVNIHKQLDCKACSSSADPTSPELTHGEHISNITPSVYYAQNNFDSIGGAIMKNEIDQSVLDFIRNELNIEVEDDNADDPPIDASNFIGIENDFQASDDFMSYCSMDFVVENFFDHSKP